MLVQGVYNAQQAQTQQQNGVTDNYITIFADGADIGIVCAVNQLLANAVSLTAKGSLSSTGGYQGATGVCHRIPSGDERRYYVQQGVDVWLGFIGSATGTMRLYQSNPPLV